MGDVLTLPVRRPAIDGELQAIAEARARIMAGDFYRSDCALLLRSSDGADRSLALVVRRVLDYEAAESLRRAERSSLEAGLSDASRREARLLAGLLLLALPSGLVAWIWLIGPLMVDAWMFAAHGVARLIQIGGGIVGGWLP